MIMIVSRLQEGIGETFVQKAAECRWISMQTVAPFYQKCANSRTIKSQGRSVLKYNGKQDLILISKKKFWCSCDLDVFVPKEQQYCKQSLAFLLAFKQSVWPLFGLFFALFGFLLKFSSGNPGCAECFSISGCCFLSVAVLLLSQINLSGSGLYITT